MRPPSGFEPPPLLCNVECLTNLPWLFPFVHGRHCGTHKVQQRWNIQGFGSELRVDRQQLLINGDENAVPITHYFMHVGASSWLLDWRHGMDLHDDAT